MSRRWRCALARRIALLGECTAQRFAGGEHVIGLFIARVAIFLIVAATRPADFRVERSRTIAAPAAALFDQVNDHKKFQKWNPWDKMDPSSKTT